MDEKALIAFTQDIIRIRSLSGEEEAVVERVLREMQNQGFDDIWVDSAGNALGIIQGERPGKCLLLDSHIDTVNANPADWDCDPFAAEIRAGRIYGRGSADNKGNLAAMLYGASAVDRQSIYGSIIVCASVHEEVMEGGTLQVVIRDNNPDYVIIGEATQLNLNRGGRGRAEVVVETTGKSAHSSSPEVGKCAVHAMIELIQAIEQTPVMRHPLLGAGSMVLTDIHSEPYPGHSVIPNHCRVTFDRRLLPGETIDSILDELHQTAAKVGVEAKITILEGQETTYRGHHMRSPKFFPAWELEENHPLVMRAYRALLKDQPLTQISSFQFCTNAASSAGLFAIPTIGYGLGSEKDAHTVNESIAIDELIQAAQGYRLICEAVLASD